MFLLTGMVRFLLLFSTLVLNRFLENNDRYLKPDFFQILNKKFKTLSGGKKDVIPRMVYVDASEWVKKGEISFSKEVTVQQKTFSRFYIIDPHKGRSGR